VVDEVDHCHQGLVAAEEVVLKVGVEVGVHPFQKVDEKMEGQEDEMEAPPVVVVMRSHETVAQNLVEGVEVREMLRSIDHQSYCSPPD